MKKPAQGGLDRDKSLGGLSRDYSLPIILAVDRLPPPLRARYLCDCARWQTAFRHHRAIMRLLAAAA